MDERFSRLEAMLGAESMQILRRSHIMVVGVGGVGGGAVEALARSGVGKLSLVDCDTVDVTNLNRQFAALSNTIGMQKTAAMALRVRQINPCCHVRERVLRVDEESVDSLFDEPVDYVLDCIDDLNAKVLLVLRCRRFGVPLVSSMGAGNRMDPSQLRITDVFKTNNDPVARIMRKRLREAGVAKLCVCASGELPKKCRVETAPGRFSPASSPFVPPAAGILMASHAVRTLCGDA